MILTLIVALLAGWAARAFEPRIIDLLAGTPVRALLADPAAARALALLTTLFCAAVLLWVLDAGGRVAPFVLGAALGHFQKELREALVSRRS